MRGLVLTRRVVVHIVTPTASAVALGMFRRLHHMRLLFVMVVDFSHMTRGRLLVMILLCHVFSFLALL
jgi:hypothetical protein